MTNGVLPTDLVTRNRQVAEAALRPWAPAFTHGDVQLAHVSLDGDGDGATGTVDRSEAGQGHPPVRPRHLHPRTSGRPRQRPAGYGTDVDFNLIHTWWSLRSLLAVRGLVDPTSTLYAPGCEVDVPRSRM
ncbi:hypothetical protein [Kitasatospora sp. NPDC048407]|uniref:hypothetical protein n=1 Tax=Kitasatospora sp. NPDC048407 TaxID=3364051 RepID=UPI00371DC352